MLKAMWFKVNHLDIYLFPCLYVMELLSSSVGGDKQFISENKRQADTMDFSKFHLGICVKKDDL